MQNKMFASKLFALNFIKRSYFNTLKVGILGVPFEKGQIKKGVSNGPNSIRKYGLIERLEQIEGEIDIKDYGDVRYTIPENLANKMVPNMKEYSHIAACNYEVSKNVEKILRNGRICVTLGGDHSVALGTVDGHLKARNARDICLIWVDAHPDLNTNKTSQTGNVHGMPMALLAKELSDYWPYLPGFDWQQPLISLKNIAYIGLRSIDHYERIIIDKLRLNAFGMEDIENCGITSIVEMALAKIDPDQTKSIHVSFDIDSLDSLEAPSTGTSVRGGMTLREGIQLMEIIHRTGRLTGLDLVEVNPTIGSEDDVQRTVDAAIHIIAAGLGHSRRGGLHSKKSIKTLPLQTFPPTQSII